MFERKKNLVAEFVWIFATGAVLGAAAALLLAPMTGKKMQKKVTDVTGKVLNTVEDIGTAVRRAATA